MNRLLLEIILIFGLSLALNFGYAWWKGKQQDIGYQKRDNEIVVEVAKKNETIVTAKKKVKHENQNRNRDALVRLHCDRGWVLDPDQCTGNAGQMRNNVRRHIPRLNDNPSPDSNKQRNVVEIKKKAQPAQRRLYNE